MTAEDAPLLLFADQLGAAFHGGEHAHRPVLLVESASALRRPGTHRQKLHLILSALRHAAAGLGDRATLLRSAGYAEALDRYGRAVLVFEPTSWAAERFVRRLADDGRVAAVLPTPAFALSRADFGRWAGGRTRFRLEDFYREQRRRFGVLMDGEAPVGGRWNYDADNREPPPRGCAGLDVTPPWQPQEDEIDARVRRDLDAMARSGAIRPVGADGPRLFAVTPGEADAALRHFVEHRLALFGRYEDAMMSGDWAMAHSLLSVPLNLGVLHPLDAVEAAERSYRAGAAPLSAVEGFIRQILGWREYMWQLYWHFGPDYLDSNTLGARTALPDWWTALDADAVQSECLRVALAGVRDRGWAHHIQRLMVLGNHALQRGYEPRALSEWFARSFVDGFAWVMPTNVIGMSQHADGGRVATKPYASGGAYITKMSDHCRSCRFDPRKRLGEDACPFTAGYWQFVDRHAEVLAANMRTARAVSALRRLADLEAVLDQERRRETF